MQYLYTCTWSSAFSARKRTFLDNCANIFVTLTKRLSDPKWSTIMSNNESQGNAPKMLQSLLFDPNTAKRNITDVRYGALDSQQLDLYLPDEGDGPDPLLFADIQHIDEIG